MIDMILGTGFVAACLLPIVVAAVIGGVPPREGPHQVEISNDELRAKVYLPDAHRGFYRGTRFDWSGIVSSLEYKGHNYYGQWYTRADPRVHDFEFQGNEIVSSTCTKVVGPAEEFESNQRALGFDEAKVGGTFVKIGVGVLRKDSDTYDAFKQYELVDGGKWTVNTRPDSVEFTHELADPTTGYAYIYRKTVRLIPGKPEMVLEHHLKNTGRLPIHSAVYNHNFLVLDHQTPGPDFSVTFSYQDSRHSLPAKSDLGRFGATICFPEGAHRSRRDVHTLAGFSDNPQDNEIRIENRKVGAGMVIRGDRPLSHMALFPIPSVLAVEPFITMAIEPGSGSIGM